MLKKGRDWRQAAEKPFYRLRGGGKLSERPLLSLRGSSPKTGAIFGRVVPFPPCGWRHLGASPTPLTGGLHLHTFAANFGFCVAVHRGSIPFVHSESLVRPFLLLEANPASIHVLVG